MRLDALVAQTGGELAGDGSRLIERLGPLDDDAPATLSFLANPRYRHQLAGTRAAAVIVAPALRDEALAACGAAIVAPDPYLHFARLTQFWAARSRPAPRPGVHPSAVVEPGARVDPSASVGPLCVVGEGAEVAAGAVLVSQVHLGRDAVVGAGTRLGPRVVLADGCRIGERGIVHGGVVIGADGFGFAPTDGRWEKIEQLGAVRIGDDVEIGANTCIDRGALGDTVVEDGVKLDNLIQIGHNVRIGRHTAMAGCTGVAGSTRIGAHCAIGGAAIILGHLEIADHVTISAATVVSHSIHQRGHYSGFFPMDDNARWEKNAATLRQLHTLRDRLRALEKKLA
ncbi:UDP-3-O-(3-hydroxymyristoyl)glucosamine N-acyltransferase [Aquabacterium sp. J223]|nr:UDP-3-O-(3-hydroxymyristoyl)glucosamine N-acyltransferase [Aquabacterium sp. J223]UUX97820.1 UDP-3-O-(3-hydroxymyristoyl)glucosamine N-acyltransferase [Aquabacterium sp. J223]